MYQQNVHIVRKLHQQHLQITKSITNKLLKRDKMQFAVAPSSLLSKT